MVHHANSLAPWAELVPDTGTMTVDDLLARPDDGWQYELAGYLLWALLSYVMPRQLGAVTGADGTYDLTQPGDTDETGLVPGGAFVAAPAPPPRTSPEYAKAPHLAPDLVAEVASPSQFRPEMRDKAERYIKAGVRLVWMVWPKR